MRASAFVMVLACVTAQADELKDLPLDKCDAQTALNTLH